jgi:hypothetical protein
LHLRKEPFSNDCSKTEGGGGYPEKIARFRQFRETAFDLQDVINKISLNEAMNELVQEMWNGPFIKERKVQKIKNTKTWNIPLTNFVPNKGANNSNNINYKNISRSNNNVTNLRPIVLPIGSKINGKNNIAENSIGYIETGNAIYFRHRKQEGELVNHFEKREGISQDFLIETIKQSNKEFGTPEFGYCMFGCGARLYPDEIKEFVPEEEYTTYKGHFNKKFASAIVGGKRKYTIQKGGQNNVLVEAELALCYAPKRTTGGFKRRTFRKKRMHKRRTYRRRNK